MKVRIIKANGVQKKQDFFSNLLKFDGSIFTITTSGLNFPDDWATTTWGTDTGNNMFFNVSSSTSANGHAYDYSASS